MSGEGLINFTHVISVVVIHAELGTILVADVDLDEDDDAVGVILHPNSLCSCIDR